MLILNLHMMLSSTGDGELHFDKDNKDNSWAAILLAIPTLLLYVLMFAYTFICKFKTTVDAHVAQHIRRESKRPRLRPQVEDQFSALLLGSASLAKTHLTKAIGFTTDVDQNDQDAAKNVLADDDDPQQIRRPSGSTTCSARTRTCSRLQVVMIIMCMRGCRGGSLV